MPLTGHCLCGAVTYSAAVDQPLITALVFPALPDEKLC